MLKKRNMDISLILTMLLKEPIWNWTFFSLDGGSFEITLTVPLLKFI